MMATRAVAGLCLLLAMSAIAGAQQSVGGAPGPAPSPEPEEEVTWWPFILLSVILVLSITFETVKETIEEHTPHVFEPITDAFFGELATLGFIGAIAFTLTYNFSGEGGRYVTFGTFTPVEALLTLMHTSQ